MNPKKTFVTLKQVHRIKKKGVRKYKKVIHTANTSVIEREISLTFGSVWGIQDASVPFDKKRKVEEVKARLRPCLILETPDSFEDYDVVHVAPGTSKFHPIGKQHPPCLMAKVPPEDLEQTTYFLLYFSWYSVQKNLDRKITELSTGLMNLLRKMI